MNVDFSVAEGRPSLDYRRIEVIDPQMANIQRLKSVAQRLAIVSNAHRMGLNLTALGVRLQHPALSSSEVDAEAVRRMICGTN